MLVSLTAKVSGSCNATWLQMWYTARLNKSPCISYDFFYKIYFYCFTEERRSCLIDNNICIFLWNRYFRNILDFFKCHSFRGSDTHFFRLLTNVALEISRALLWRRKCRSCTYSVWSPGMVSSQWEFSSLSCTYTAPPGRPVHLCGTPLPSPSLGYPRVTLFYNCFH